MSAAEYRRARGIRIVCRTMERASGLMWLMSRLKIEHGTPAYESLLATCRRVWARMERFGRTFAWPRDLRRGQR